jgi:hypothetical protein
MKGTTDLSSYASIASSINSIANQSDSSGASSRVTQAIQSAASVTGVNFSYLMQKASQESSFDPTAKATTSSATGLFQFTKQTWLQMIKQYGAQYGLGGYAAQITQNADGHMSVSDPATKQAILALRNDPQVSAEMAGELDKQNAASLKHSVGGKIGGTELYLAHFLGAGGASNFISEMRSNPNATAADVLPTAAAANPSVFYDKSGEPRSLKQIYQHFAQKFDGNSTVQMASAKSSGSSSYAPNFYTVAANAPASTGLASLYSAASPLAAGTSATASAVGTSNVGGMSLPSSSTMFTAMLLGQMNDSTGYDPASSAINAINQADNKKKNAIEVLSAVG